MQLHRGFRIMVAAAGLNNGLVAGVIAPLVMHSALGLAAASIGLMSIGLIAWRVVRVRWPETGTVPAAVSEPSADPPP